MQQFNIKQKKNSLKITIHFENNIIYNYSL